MLSRKIRNMATAIRDGFYDGVMDERYVRMLVEEFGDLADQVERLENMAVPPAARVFEPVGNVVPLVRRPAPPAASSGSGDAA